MFGFKSHVYQRAVVFQLKKTGTDMKEKFMFMKVLEKSSYSSFSLLLLLLMMLQSGCTKTVYVRQNGQTYNDYEAIKHDRIEKVDARPKQKKHEKFKKYKKKRRRDRN
jgi:hypothetical protein